MIMNVFEPIWFIEVSLIPALVLIITFCLRRKSLAEKKSFLKKLDVFAMIVYVLYKIAVFTDPELHLTFWKELPLNLCNLCIFLDFAALSDRFRFLQPFLFFWAPFGYLLAMVFPTAKFMGVPFWYPRCLGFCLTHIMGMVIVLLFVTLGIYRPAKKDILTAWVTMAVISFVIHLINLFFRETGLAQTNYFYTFGIEGNPVCDFLLKIIPIPYLFYYPASAVVVVLDFGLYGLTRIGKKKGA